MLSKEEGGINFPNLSGYNLSCLLRHVLDWLRQASCFSNWELESELAAPWPLISLIHTGFPELPTHVKHSVTLRDTIVAWKEVRKAFGLPFLLSKYMPLWGHPEYSRDNNYDLYYADLRAKGIRLASHIMHPEEKRWLSVQEILDRFSLPEKHSFKVTQLFSLCRSRLRDLSQEAGKNALDSLLDLESQTCIEH